MLTIWKKIFSLFSGDEKPRFYLLLSSSTLLSLFDVVGFASVMPFIAVAVNPDIIESNSYINYLYTLLEFESSNSFLVFLGLSSFFLLLFIKIVFIFDARYSLNFWYKKEYQVSVQLLRYYIGKKYEFFLTRSSPELQKNILSEAERAVNNVLMAGVDLFASAVSTLFLLIILVFVDPYVALLTLIFFGTTYGIIFLFVHKKIKLLGKSYVAHETEMYKRLGEAFDGIKDIKINQKESFYTHRYDKPKSKIADNATRFDLLSLIPEQILETVSFGAIIFATIYFTVFSEDMGYALSLVALYAFAAYRILPYLKTIFDGLESMQYNMAAVNEIINDFSFSSEPPSDKNKLPFSISFNTSFKFENISYQYPNSNCPVVSKLNFTIPTNSLTCLFGPSGVGKTTTIDLMMGLLQPHEGNIFIDDTALTSKNCRDWQTQIGHVSHLMFMTEDTITQNIAFGVDKDNISHERLKLSAKLACIDEFILNELPNGYDTMIGEEGIHLSAGQKQRICIARALYKNSPVIVFDEATNALDKKAESNIMDNLLQLKSNKTIVLITHKLSIAQLCDSIILLSKDAPAYQGTYQELHQQHPELI